MSQTAHATLQSRKSLVKSAYTKSTWPWGRDTFTYNLLPPDNKTAKPESNNKNTYIFNFSWNGFVLSSSLLHLQHLLSKSLIITPWQVLTHKKNRLKAQINIAFPTSDLIVVYWTFGLCTSIKNVDVRPPELPCFVVCKMVIVEDSRLMVWHGISMTDCLYLSKWAASGSWSPPIYYQRLITTNPHLHCLSLVNRSHFSSSKIFVIAFKWVADGQKNHGFGGVPV